jgi:hypothetical protein
MIQSMSHNHNGIKLKINNKEIHKHMKIKEHTPK